jgi:hypothetical protein
VDVLCLALFAAHIRVMGLCEQMAGAAVSEDSGNSACSFCMHA